jgi:hypothetical protein
VRPLAVVNALALRLKSYHLLIRVSFCFLVLKLYQSYTPALAVATNQVVLTTQPVITTTEAVPTQTLVANCVASETTLPDGSVLVSSVYVTVGGGNSPNTSATSGGGSSSSSSNYGAIVGGVVGGVVALLVLISVIWVLWRRNRKMAKQIKENEEEEKRNGIVNVEELLPSPYVQVCHDYDVFLTEFILLAVSSFILAYTSGPLGISTIDCGCVQTKCNVA